MPLVVKDPALNNVPRAWARCQEYLDNGTYPTTMGFHTTRTDLYRFRSRFRLAKSFRSITLDGYATADTVNGYGAIFRTFLVWSTFEIFLNVMSLDRKATEPLGKKYRGDKVLTAVRAIPDHAKFLIFIRDCLDSKAQKLKIDDLIAGKDTDVSYIASGVRHIFVHGELTPHSGAGNPEAAQLVCDLVSQFLLDVMDNEFEEIVTAYKT